MAVSAKRKKGGRSETSSQLDFREFAKRLGSRGGKKRSEKLSPERRKEIAKKAAMARWANKKRG